MNWYQDLYVGGTFEEKKESVIDRVEKEKSVEGLYLILLRRDDDKNQLEILSQKELKRHTPWLGPFMIIGIAHRKKEANELLVQILDQVYRETGTANMRDYFLSKDKEGRKDE